MGVEGREEGLLPLRFFTAHASLGVAFLSQHSCSHARTHTLPLAYSSLTLYPHERLYVSRALLRVARFGAAPPTRRVARRHALQGPPGEFVMGFFTSMCRQSLPLTQHLSLDFCISVCAPTRVKSPLLLLHLSLLMNIPLHNCMMMFPLQSCLSVTFRHLRVRRWVEQGNERGTGKGGGGCGAGYVCKKGRECILIRTPWKGRRCKPQHKNVHVWEEKHKQQN